MLEYCLDGLKGKKERLFDHLVEITKPTEEPSKAVSQLKNEVSELKGEEAAVKNELPRFEFSEHAVESDQIFAKSIAGKDDSIIAPLIEKLGNSDWVRQGLDYLPTDNEADADLCPFCQENTITSALTTNIREYFDETFQRAIARIEILKRRYQRAYDGLGDVELYLEHPFSADYKALIAELHKNCNSVLDDNMKAIDAKLASPHSIRRLTDSRPSFEALNVEVDSVNNLVKDHNQRLANRVQVLQAIKVEFWKIMRWRYDQTISRYAEDVSKASAKIGGVEGEISVLEEKIESEKAVILAAQKETVNIEEAIGAINAGLIDLGIDDIRIVQHADNLYRVVRADESNDAFRTLSEGWL